MFSALHNIFLTTLALAVIVMSAGLSNGCMAASEPTTSDLEIDRNDHIDLLKVLAKTNPTKQIASAEGAKDREQTQPEYSAKEAPLGTEAEPAIACPSQVFEEFFKVFVNDRAVQLTYVRKPFKAITPYYWQKPSALGDSRFPKWNELFYDITKEHYNYDLRYDNESKQFGITNARLSTHKPWTIYNQDGTKRWFKPQETSIKRISRNRYEVQAYGIGHGTIDTFVYESDCWFFAETWDRSEEELVNCSDPETCSKMLWWEGDEECPSWNSCHEKN